MDLQRALGVASLVALMAISGCGGGGGGFDANKVTVSVAPATSTISANGTATLTATVSGLCSTCASYINEWNITENDGDASCSWFDTPPTQPCPGGTIEQTEGTHFLTVTYHAPSAAGTYHVAAVWCICFGSSLTKEGHSVITVNP